MSKRYTVAWQIEYLKKVWGDWKVEKIWDRNGNFYEISPPLARNMRRAGNRALEFRGLAATVVMIAIGSGIVAVRAGLLTSAIRAGLTTTTGAAAGSFSVSVRITVNVAVIAMITV